MIELTIGDKMLCSARIRSNFLFISDLNHFISYYVFNAADVQGFGICTGAKRR